MIQIIGILIPILVTSNWALVFLLQKKSVNPARHFLGWFMGVAYLLYMGHGFFFLGWYDLYIHYDPVYTFTSLVVFPMYYQYLRLLTIDRGWQRHYLFHYIPGVVLGLASVLLHYHFHDIAHADPVAYFAGNIHSIDFPGHVVSYFYLIKRILYAGQVVIYMWLGIRLLIQHQQRVDQFYSDSAFREINWVKALHYSLLFAAILSLVFNILGRTLFLDHPHWLVVPSLLFSVNFFILGYLGNSQNQQVARILDQESVDIKDSEVEELPENELRTQLELLFREKKVYLNPRLNIWDVTRALGTNRSYVSQLINHTFGMNFSAYVNQFRVAEAKRVLANRESDRLSLDTISEQCGFGSLNNFIRAFRMIENTTPGKYREACLQNRSKKEKDVTG